jgi:hypothetical protein
MWDDEEIEIASKAMQNSKAWPAVFKAGAAQTLAKAASEAVSRHRAEEERKRRVREIVRDYEM